MPVLAPNDVEDAAAAAQCVVNVHERLVEYLRAGLTLAEVDGFVSQVLMDLKCRSCFHLYKPRGYPPFPSVSCLSVNDCIVHGTHDMQQPPLQPGDVFSIDIGVKYNGWIGDAAWTYAIEHATDEARKLMDCGKESLRLGIKAMQPGRQLVEWAKAVQTHAEDECGYRLVRGLGGHGYGRKLHGAPFISNVVPSRPGEWPECFSEFEPGMLLAVEPMIAIGTQYTRSERRSWPIYTQDGSLAVHHEADVLITDEGPRNLTQGLFDLPDVVG